MATISLKTQSAGRQMAADIADAEGVRIGKAAKRKERQESSDSIEAVLSSDDHGGRAVYWQRRIKDRDSIMVERSGAYTARAFLRMAEKAAGQAGRGRWNRPEAVEAVAAELVARTMAKTGGRMPKAGSLGRQHGDHENPDLAYLTSAARHLIASAMRGEDAGLASEAAPIGDADQGEAAGLNLSDLMGEAEAAAEGPRDPYVAEPAQPGADLLNPDTREAVAAVALAADGRPAAVTAALAAALRGPLAKSADLADAGYASSPASQRKAAQRGREILRPLLSDIMREREENADDPDAEVSAAAEAWANLCVNENSEPADTHPMESTPSATYRRPKRPDWPQSRDAEEIAPVTSYTATAPDWRTV